MKDRVKLFIASLFSAQNDTPPARRPTHLEIQERGRQAVLHDLERI